MSLISFSPLIVAAQGKSGSNTFKMIHSNPLLQRIFQRMTNNKFIDRNQRCIFLSLTKSWALLSDSDRDLWAALAVQINAGSIKYYGKKVSGFSLFMSYQLNAQACGVANIINCPDFSVIKMPNIAYLNVTVSVDDIILEVKNINNNDVSIIIQASPLCSPGISVQNIFRTIDKEYCPIGVLNFSEAANYINIYQNWNVSGSKIFFRVRLVSYIYGYSSHWYNTSCLIP